MNTVEYTILDGAKTRAITSSTDATPIVITTTADHGLSTGDRVSIMGHTTNTNANGTWTVTVTAVNKFSLDGSIKTSAGAGADGTYTSDAPKNIFCADFGTATISIATDGGADYYATLKVAASNSETCPDFAKAQSVTNQYDYVNIVDLQSGLPISGDTGLVYAGADDYRNFEININPMRWFTVIPVSGSEGEITVSATLTSTNSNRA